MTFDIYEFLKKRPLSWSALSSFEYDPAQWYSRYILNTPQEPSAEMLFGKVFADSCEDRRPLAPVTLLSKMEHSFECSLGRIPLVGYADTFNDVTLRETGEYKTSKYLWTQEKVDNHGQIKMYALMNYLINKVPPEECTFWLENVQTEEQGDYTIRLKRPITVHHFETKISLRDILDFGMRITKTVEDMEQYVREHE